jgi:signal transduction histidine kinase
MELLDISRISAGRLEYRMVPRDLTALVWEAVEEQCLHKPARRIELDLPDEQVPVIADADGVGQVLTNYLANAVKYSESGRPIVIGVRAQGPSARVEVRDQGPGLSLEPQHHLFERFYRVAGVEVVSGSSVGLGLGLYISRAIVEHHGGRVGVESALGECSSFGFELPLGERK